MPPSFYHYNDTVFNEGVCKVTKCSDNIFNSASYNLFYMFRQLKALRLGRDHALGYLFQKSILE